MTQRDDKDIEAVAAAAAENVIDRRRLRRKLRFWRVLGVLGLLALVAWFAWPLIARGGPGQGGSAHIARISVSGLITGDRETLQLIDRVAKSANAKAVLVAIESPGGTTTGSEKIYDELRRLAAKKPVVAVIGATGASGAYVAAMGAERIFAHGNSLVGSIGVLFQYPNVGRLLETWGVKVEEVKSSPLKAAPNPFEPASPEARAALAALVSDSYDWFRGLVRERRGLDEPMLAQVTDGRVFTGRQALALRLVDQLGGERDAQVWLETEKGVEAGLPVRDWKPPSATRRFGVWSAAALGAELAGFTGLAQTLRRHEIESEALALDGLLALWHVQRNN